MDYNIALMSFLLIINILLTRVNYKGGNHKSALFSMFAVGCLFISIIKGLI